MKKIVIAFDIGTTFSGVSYCITEGRGHQTIIEGVTNFPGQALAYSDSKIPSHLLYKQGKVFRAGAEVDLFESFDTDETRGILVECTKTRWFKLELRPESIPLMNSARIESNMPPGLSAVKVYSDFLRYLFDCAKNAIQKANKGLELLLDSRDRVRFILTHPNGWEPVQQRHLRKAALKAGLISCLDDHRLHLLTEGEAALHYCIHKGLTRSLLRPGTGVMVVDAGGGTIDLSAYQPTSKTEDHIPKFEEIAASQCLAAGSVFVTQRAADYLTSQLAGTIYRDNVEQAIKKFDSESKRIFGCSTGIKDIHLPVGFPSDPPVSSPEIKRGTMKIPCDVVAEFFKPSLDAIIGAIEGMRKSLSASDSIEHVFLVGGFSSSEWLFEKLEEHLASQGIGLTRPDSNRNKVVADGAIAYHLNRCVDTRVARLTYGTRYFTEYDPENTEHQKRIHRVFTDDDGKKSISGLFDPIIPKGTQVQEAETFSSQFFRNFKDITGPGFENPLKDLIFCYRGDKVLQRGHEIFMDQEEDMYEELFTLRSTLDGTILNELKKLSRAKHQDYIRFDYHINFRFGLTEMEVQATTKYKRPGSKKPTLKQFKSIVFQLDEEDNGEDESADNSDNKNP